MITRNRILGALLAVALVPTVSAAWNDKGHMMVAFIAYQNLTPAVRNRVDVLLALNPHVARWRTMIPASVPTQDRPAMLFMIAATWADQIKSRSDYSDDGSQNGNVPDGASSSQNTGYDDKLRHKYWHFVDRPFSRDGTTLPAIPEPSAQTRIRLFRTVLASTATDALKSYDLVWLLHLVGDVHQPLHAVTRVRHAQPNGDAGGNAVTVCPVAPCASPLPKLHSFWDGALGPEEDVVTAASAAKALPQAEAMHAAITDEKEWIAESFNLAQGEVYRSPILSGLGPFTLTPAYRNTRQRIGRERVALAGARLGALLNAELK